MIELNGNTKIAVRLAEVLTIFSALVWFGYRAAKLETTIQGLIEGQRITSDMLRAHCRIDWTLQHSMLMASRAKAMNPEIKFEWPDPVRIHDDIRRGTE